MADRFLQTDMFGLFPEAGNRCKLLCLPTYIV